VDPDGYDVFGDNYSPSISADGRYVAFESAGNILVPDDFNFASDIFVHDRQTGLTTRVSVASDGTEADGESFTPAISADGRYVVFGSYATNLVGGDSNGLYDVFVHDRQTRQTTRVSKAPGRAQANGFSYAPTLSADGRFVGFESYASNLVTGDTNRQNDVFVHDRQTGRTTRVSVASGGIQADGYSYSPTLSANGRFVAFYSSATNLVTGDTNAKEDVFVHDRQTRRTTRVSVASDGKEANGESYSPSLSADGRYVTFESSAVNLVTGDSNRLDDVFVHDRQTRRTTRVSVASDGKEANGESYSHISSADGRFVAFFSSATNLVAEDTNATGDIFIHDRQTRQTTRVSVNSGGRQADGYSYAPSLSADGRSVVFESYAANLIPVDTNEFQDVFVRDRLFDKTTSTDLALAATDAPDPAQRGKILTYAFTLTNKGANQATGATLVDVLSSNLDLDSVTPSQGSCNKAHVLVCRLGNLAKDKRAKVIITTKVRSNAPTGTLGNTANTMANTSDPNQANNTKAVKSTVQP
jgi:uncharacterized repeat protein (TIGR01451 family)